jgi:DNA repair photolyase
MITNKIGITECGDAGLDFSWVDKLFDANIIISKSLNDTLIEKLVKNKSKIIFHMTCTGWGGTTFEPNVPEADFTRDQFDKLIESGFPLQQVVLRVDPIIPIEHGIKRARYVLDIFKDSGIKRVRYSFLDMYEHVFKRFVDAGITPPYSTFTAPKYMINDIMDLLMDYDYEFEACGEYTEHKIGCVSKKDLDILGVEIEQEGCSKQRKSCSCFGNKTQLIKGYTRCAHKCLYCFWRD